MASASKRPPSALREPDRPKVSRAQKNRDTDEAIKSAALELVATTGVDGLALTKIADRAGFTTGALYNRFDSPEDVALELWETVLRDQFLRLVREFDEFMSSTDAEPSEWLLGELTDPSDLTAGAIETVAVARRFPLLVDSVRSDVDTVFRTLRSAPPDRPAAIRAIVLTIPVGCVLTSRYAPESRPPWRSKLLRLRSLAHDPSHLHRPPVRVEPTRIEYPAPDTGDAVLDDFVAAVMQVVARVGFERAAANRIARTAGHSFSSAYVHVRSKDELMHLAIGRLIELWLARSTRFASLDEDEYVTANVAWQQGLADDGNRAVRQFRAETVMAMRHHADLADTGRRCTEAAVDRYTAPLTGLDPSTIESAAGLWYLVDAHGVGLITLSLLIDAFATVDWTPAAQMAFEMVHEAIIEPLRGLAGA